jgi:excisionase family DNA binding protein
MDRQEMRTTIIVPEIVERLGVCEETVYEMLRNHEIPNIRHGHRFIISRAAYQHWEATIGEAPQEPHTTWPHKISMYLHAFGSSMVRMLHRPLAA